MAKKNPEQLAYSWLKQKLPQEYHVQRIETSTTSGVPDINMIVDGTEIWMEVKTGQKLKSGFVRIRKEQYAWMKRRAMCGGVCIVADRTAATETSITWSLWGIRKDTPAVPSSTGSVIVAVDCDFNGIGSGLFEEALELLINRAKR